MCNALLSSLRKRQKKDSKNQATQHCAEEVTPKQNAYLKPGPTEIFLSFTSVCLFIYLSVCRFVCLSVGLSLCTCTQVHVYGYKGMHVKACLWSEDNLRCGPFSSTLLETGSFLLFILECTRIVAHGLLRVQPSLVFHLSTDLLGL